MKKMGIIELAIGALMLLSALITYIPEVECMYELTFLSNLAGGCLFLVDGLLNITAKKTLHNQFFLIVNIALFTVFFISVCGTLSGFAHFNFSGGMFLLHVINPTAVMIFYLLTKGEKDFHIKSVLLAPLLLMLFMCFDYIRFLLTGNLIYGLFPAEEVDFLTALIIGAVTYCFGFLVSLAVYSLGRLFKNKLPFNKN